MARSFVEVRISKINVSGGCFGQAKCKSLDANSKQIVGWLFFLSHKYAFYWRYIAEASFLLARSRYRHYTIVIKSSRM